MGQKTTVCAANMYKTSHTFLDQMTNDPFLCAEDPHQQATFSEPSELGWVGSSRYRLSNLGNRLLYINGIQLSFLKLRDESGLSGGNVFMRNKGGASKSYGKGTFCLFAIMICINKSAPEKHISAHILLNQQAYLI